MNPYLRIIGDVHGKYEKYIDLALQSEYSIQIGDMGFNYQSIMDLDSTRHKIIGGNHDNYTEDDHGNFIWQTPSFLGDFGLYEIPGFEIFYVRGGKSIDKWCRTPGYDWWENEQLSFVQSKNVIQLYKEIKPNFVISHECPASVIDLFATRKFYRGQLLTPSFTAKLLDKLFEIHQPKFWIFGHHHIDWKYKFKNTTFQCLGELQYLDLGKNHEL